MPTNSFFSCSLELTTFAFIALGFKLNIDFAATKLIDRSKTGAALDLINSYRDDRNTRFPQSLLFYINAHVYNKNGKELIITYDLEKTKDDVMISVYDMLGREMTFQSLPSNQNRASISIEHISNGVYVLGFYTKHGIIAKSHKLIKY